MIFLSPCTGLPCYDDNAEFELHLSQSSDLRDGQPERLVHQNHYLQYKHWTSELAGLTQGNASAHAIVMGYLSKAKAEVIELRRKQTSGSLINEHMFHSSNLPINTQKQVPRGGRQWIR
jgi:hypothetical protein